MVCGQAINSRNFALANGFEAQYRDLRTTRMLLIELYQNETRAHFFVFVKQVRYILN
jgi:hypothetical protein